MKSMNMKLLTLVSLLTINFYKITGQSIDSKESSNGHSISEENNVSNPCITEFEYAELENRLQHNMQILSIPPKQGLRVESNVTPLGWPLRAAAGLSDCSYYHISAYVDQNTAASQIQDFNCGSNTYDGHKGTDISIWPFNFYKMDNDLVEVIAAASGTIIDKHDGEYDRNCSASTVTANYMLVQHADGSHALYWHMKNGSLSTKSIGQSIAEGEYIGIVGSSGSSSGPHLHFEVWSGATVSTRIDPYSGTCNSLNAVSWWNTQKSYLETGVLKASVHTTDAVFPACPATETSNESNSFQIPFQGPGLAPGYAKFYIFLRSEVTGLTADMTIKNPNGSTHSSWSYTSAMDYKVRAWAWSKLLPTDPGNYTFNCTYNGETCSSTFSIVSAIGIDGPENPNALKAYFHPASNKIILNLEEGSLQEIELYNVLGARVLNQNVHGKHSEVNQNLEMGIYFYKVKDQHQMIYTGRLFIRKRSQ